MGNSQQQSKAIQTGSDKMVLQLRIRSIILHYGYKFSLYIGDLAMFPHGLSGLKLWQSNVVLARFVVINNSLFKGKKVLQLGAGTGIGGIALSKWTKCQSIAMSDSRQQVIRNMTKNCERNEITNIVVFRLNLSQYQHFTNKYDVLLCSQILRPSPISFQEIYSLFRHFLNPGGCVYIIMSDNVEKIDAFSGLVNSEDFQFKYEKLVDEEYYTSPLLNKVEGFKEFERLSKEDYYVVKMKKKQPVQDKAITKKLPELPQIKPVQTNQQLTYNKKVQEPKPQQISLKVEEVKEEQSPIKAFSQNIETQQKCEREQQERKQLQEIKPQTQSEQKETSDLKPIEEKTQQKQPHSEPTHHQNEQSETKIQSTQLQKETQNQSIHESQQTQKQQESSKLHETNHYQQSPPKVEAPLSQQPENFDEIPKPVQEQNDQSEVFEDAIEGDAPNQISLEQPQISETTQIKSVQLPQTSHGHLAPTYHEHQQPKQSTQITPEITQASKENTETENTEITQSIQPASNIETQLSQPTQPSQTVQQAQPQQQNEQQPQQKQPQAQQIQPQQQQTQQTKDQPKQSKSKKQKKKR